jgi:hypothetical protein
MLRPPRLHIPGGCYHVMLRGNHREPLFGSVADRLVLNDIVVDVLGCLDTRIHALCWMSNHLHALLQITNCPLGSVMQRIRYKAPIVTSYVKPGTLDSVFLARKLTHITCDMQLGVDIEGLRHRRPDAPALADLYDRLGFGPLLRRSSQHETSCSLMSFNNEATAFQSDTFNDVLAFYRMQRRTPVSAIPRANPSMRLRLAYNSRRRN